MFDCFIPIEVCPIFEGKAWETADSDWASGFWTTLLLLYLELEKSAWQVPKAGSYLSNYDNIDHIWRWNYVMIPYDHLLLPYMFKKKNMSESYSRPSVVQRLGAGVGALGHFCGLFLSCFVPQRGFRWHRSVRKTAAGRTARTVPMDFLQRRDASGIFMESLRPSRFGCF